MIGPSRSRTTLIRSRSEVFDPELRGAPALDAAGVGNLHQGGHSGQRTFALSRVRRRRAALVGRPADLRRLPALGGDRRLSLFADVRRGVYTVLCPRRPPRRHGVDRGQHGALGVGAAGICGDVLPGDWPPHREGLFLLLVLVGSAVGLWSIHSNAIVLAAMLFGLAAVRRECWWTAAWTLALAVFVKIWPVALVLLIVACWPRRFVCASPPFCAMLAAVPFFTRSPATVVRTYEDWYAVTVCPHKDRWPGYRDAWTVWARTACLITGQGPAEAADRDAWLAWD